MAADATERSPATERRDACSFSCSLTCGGPSDPNHESELDRSRRLLALAKDAEGDAYDAWRGAVDAARVAAARVRDAEGATDGR